MTTATQLTSSQSAALHALADKLRRYDAEYASKPLNVRRTTMAKLMAHGLVERRFQLGYPTYGLTDAGHLEVWGTPKRGGSRAAVERGVVDVGPGGGGCASLREAVEP